MKNRIRTVRERLHRTRITIYNGIKEDDTETENIKTELVRVPCFVVTLLYL